MAGVAAVFGQLERELIGQRTAEALARLQAEGKPYGAIPFGFARRGDRLVAHPAQQRVIRQILDLRESGASFRKIADWLNAECVPSKRGGQWSPIEHKIDLSHGFAS